MAEDQVTFSGRRGSALLIVLGMFSFMLVSAVAFSVYMRASRAPSSYVRRNASTRHLVKAALARAIDEIDTAIGNDPYPGVGYNHNYSGTGLNDSDEHKNDNWHGHVFTPSNEVAAASTVSTLTLEALGYLPPCIIDEVRYWSRHTRTAKWRSFNYGLGRYAFTAVNVTDFFDINQFIDTDGVKKQRLNRNSSSAGRISPTYLFRGNNEGNMDSGSSAASAFLNVMSDGSALANDPKPSEVPFVSMMDFNLALGSKTFGDIASPFINRLKGGTGKFYSGNASDEVVRRQVYMAGGWNGDSNLTFQAYQQGYGGNRINLRYPEFQPFAGYAWFPENTTLSHCLNDVAENHPFWKPVNANFPVLATALLCDYLDYDNVPLSLCIPCAEAVPMICGVELNKDCVKYNVVMTEEEIAAANPDAGTPKKIKRTYSLHVEVNGVETTLTAVYPFLNGPQGHPANYTADTFIRVFFTADSGNAWEKGLRTSLADLGLGSGFTWNINTDDKGAAFFQVKCGSKGIKADEVSGVGESAEQSAIQKDIAMKSSDNITKDIMLAELVYTIDGNGNETLVDGECVNGTAFNFYDGSWTAVNFLEEIKNDSHPDVRFRPSVAVWARIRGGDGNKTVDMVPAIPEYDSLNGFSGNEKLDRFNLAGGGNAGTPLLRFFPKTDDDAAGIRLTKDYFKNNSGNSRNVEWVQKAYVANDPRINWAPEQWWATDQETNPSQLWFDNVKTFRQNHGWCDSDIFMAVSDQGYMQSMYEWMMIPQVCGLRASGIGTWGEFERSGSGYDGIVRTDINGTLHNNLMWRTYRTKAFGADSDWGRIDDVPFDEDDSGLRVNPYTDITNVMFGAFANMPRDWWAASTNYNANGKNYMNGNSFNKEYLFDWSCVYQDVYHMTRYWMSVFRGRDVENLYKSAGVPDRWQERFDGWSGGGLVKSKDYTGRDFNEYDGGERIFDWLAGDVLYKTSDNHGADVEGIMQELTLPERKFLYGYLKGCFANTSQLFLLFVRAESEAGGGGPSAGARAVALVWRDPAAPLDGGNPVEGVGKDNGRRYLHVTSGGAEETWRLNKRDYPPHRTRILFYHQLD